MHLFELLVSTGNSVQIYPLPRSGKVTIGRGNENDVRLRDVSASRQHAILHIDAAMRIEDLGSLNGVHVRRNQALEETAKVIETWLPPGENMDVAVGDAIMIGGTLLIVQRPNEDKDPLSRKGPTSFVAPVVHDKAMQDLYETVNRVATGSISVLLLGETGVGKDIMAEVIHSRSPRAKRPLVCLNCAAFSETLLESELFGHEAGAFTGAAKVKPGLFETANGGTVFLDEVGELPMTIQVKLLRVLEERKVRRVGGLAPQPFDVRFISATNRDLTREVQRGAFRQDLFYRLNGISLKIPPLRERRSEIEPLVRHFVARACVQTRLRAEPAVAPDVLEMLKRHTWPGNLRELRNVIERAVIVCQGDVIRPEHIGLDRLSDVDLVEAVSGRTTLPPLPSTGEGRDERRKIIEALEQCAGNQTQAAQALGMSRRTFVSRLDEYGIARPRKKV